MASRPQRWDFWRHVLGVLACSVVGWAAVIADIRIPVIADATYGFHELGHLMTWFLPEVYRAMMGSLFQVLIPVGLALYFLLFHRDLLGVAFMTTWAGAAAHETSVYIGDASTMLVQPSIWHTSHDWAYALTGLGRMSAADELSWTVQAAAIACVFVAMGVAAIGAVRALAESEHVAHVDSFLQRRPVSDVETFEDWTRKQETPAAPSPPSAGF